MHSSFSVSRTARLLGVPMMPENMSTPPSINPSTTPGVCVASYWSSRMSELIVYAGQQALLRWRS